VGRLVASPFVVDVFGLNNVDVAERLVLPPRIHKQAVGRSAYWESALRDVVQSEHSAPLPA